MPKKKCVPCRNPQGILSSAWLRHSSRGQGEAVIPTRDPPVEPQKPSLSSSFFFLEACFLMSSWKRCAKISLPTSSPFTDWQSIFSFKEVFFRMASWAWNFLISAARSALSEAIPLHFGQGLHNQPHCPTRRTKPRCSSAKHVQTCHSRGKNG